MANPRWTIVELQHYQFHVGDGSVAMAETDRIVRTQETCYRTITRALGGEPGFQIQYHLYPTAEAVGIAYGDNEPGNGDSTAQSSTASSSESRDTT